MKISDIAKLKSTGPFNKRRFVYNENTNNENHSGLQIRKLIADDSTSLAERKNNIEETYNNCLENVKSIFSRAAIDFSVMPSCNQMQDMIKNIIIQLQSSSVEIMDLFMKYEEGDYLYSHSVNVTFLSVMIGIWLNYNMSDLSSLATAAFFHDIGMLQFREIISQPRRLSKQERDQIDMHPNFSSRFVEQIPGLDKKLLETILFHHKRLSNSNMDLSEHAQIVGLADALEAMTHPRPYKAALQPHAAITVIIEAMNSCFSQSIVKVLVDNIGVYPVGTWVWLDTREIGLVIDANSGSPLSPKLNIMFDDCMQRLPRARIVDLSKQTNLHIKGPLEEKDKSRFKDALS